MSKKAEKSPVAKAVEEAIAAPKGPGPLTADDVKEIIAIVNDAPCPKGIPQAKFRAALIERFVAAVTAGAK